MKLKELLGEDLYQQTLKDLEPPKKDPLPTRRKRPPKKDPLPTRRKRPPQNDFKAGWQQGKRIGQKVLDNPVVNTLKKIDAWANRRSK